MNIVFMGTPDFAVPSLDILLKNNYNVVGVVTTMDKPAGRGNKISESPVKKFAVSNGLNVLQPEKLKSIDFIDQLKALNIDLIVVVAFRMLPEVVWQIPVKGTFNLHGSLLPQYRGAAPINWAIINGEKETGVTTFFIDKEIDTGKIIFYDRIPINENMTAGELHDKMMIIGADLVLKTIKAIESNTVKSISQGKMISNDEELRPAPKINKETCRIEWDNTAINVHNHIRGLSPYPGAWTEIYNLHTKEKQIVKIFSSEIIGKKEKTKPGSIITDSKHSISVETKDELISINQIQLQGKKRLTVEAFLNGYKSISNCMFI